MMELALALVAVALVAVGAEIRVWAVKRKVAALEQELAHAMSARDRQVRHWRRNFELASRELKATEKIRAEARVLIDAHDERNRLNYGDPPRAGDQGLGGTGEDS